MLRLGDRSDRKRKSGSERSLEPDPRLGRSPRRSPRDSRKGPKTIVPAKGERLIWLKDAMADRLGAMRGPQETYSEVILRLVAMEAG